MSANIVVRSISVGDIQTLYEEFCVVQGWKSKSTELFARYLEEQDAGLRRVLVAEVDGKVAGYVTLLPGDTEGPFANMGVPTVSDFNVLKRHQRQGVGAALMDAVEGIAKESSDRICLGVGLNRDYGAAQRIYVLRGYLPDGSGLWWNNRNLAPYEECVNDDDLILYLSKNL